MKRPAFQFYPADWRKDAALQSCSLAARGLWIDAICIAHECEPYGHLVVNGRAMSVAQLARLVGVTERECGRLVAELDAAGVLSKLADGTLFSRRMVRDERIREERAAGGQKGAEFGARGVKHGSKGGRPKKQKGGFETPLPSEENPPPSSSSSSSTSVEGGPSDLLSGKPDFAGTKPDAKAEKLRSLRAEAVALIDFLNVRTGKAYQHVPANVDPIVGLLKAGATTVQIRQVIVSRARKWHGDPKMEEYLRPKTLFNRTNFANYVGELVEQHDPEPAHEGGSA